MDIQLNIYLLTLFYTQSNTSIYVLRGGKWQCAKSVVEVNEHVERLLMEVTIFLDAELQQLFEHVRFEVSSGKTGLEMTFEKWLQFRSSLNQMKILMTILIESEMLFCPHFFN